MPSASLSSLAAFLDGYVDVITFEMFHVYSTMMTGNLVYLAVTLGRGDALDNIFASIVIISYILGVFLSNYIMEMYKGNELKSYLIMLPSQYISLLLLALAPNENEYYKFYVLPLITSFGMLNAWGNRLGHMPNMMTGNIQKSTETMFKYCYGIPMTKEEKEKSMITLTTLASYFSGAVSASFINTVPALKTDASPRGAILIIFFIVTLKLFFSNAYLIFPCFRNSNILQQENIIADVKLGIHTKLETDHIADDTSEVTGAKGMGRNTSLAVPNVFLSGPTTLTQSTSFLQKLAQLSISANKSEADSVSGHSTTELEGVNFSQI